MNPKKVEKEIKRIHSRNLRVEADKAWETSKFRIIFIVVLTYITSLSLFLFLGSNKPYASAIIPSAGFLIFTLTLPFLRKYPMARWQK